MENKKQTAVEWLVNVVNSCIASDYIPNEIVNQAKAMETKQIKEAFESGENNIDSDGCYIDKDYSKQYYNETYGKDNGKN